MAVEGGLSEAGPLVLRAEEALEDPSRRLDESILESLLEPAVEESCENRYSYSLELNCGVLKAYSMHPLLFNFDVVKLILAKALMKLPEEDFTLALYSIPQSVFARSIPVVSTTSSESLPEMIANEPLSPVIETLVNCESALRSCQFSDFWKIVKSDESVAFLRQIDGFFESIRAYIVTVVVRSHKSITRDVLAHLLDTQDDVLPLFANHGWQVSPSNQQLLTGKCH